MEDTKRLKIRLNGLQPGASQDELVAALQRLYPRQGPEQIRRALKRLPLLLSRSATPEQARKIKGWLESKGAILAFSPASAAARPQPQATAGRAASPPVSAESRKVEAPPSAPTPKMEGPPMIERRAKPRVHPGIEIHPMGVGEILDRSFRLLRQRFLMFFGILLIPQAGFFLMSKAGVVLMGGDLEQGDPMAMGLGFGFSALFAGLVLILLQFWAQGALIYGVSETYLGHSTSLVASFGAMRPRLGQLLGTMILMGILLGLVGISVAVVVALLVTTAKDSLVGAVSLILVVPIAVVIFFNLFLNWLLTDKVVVLEGESGMKALRRSKELMKTRTEPGIWKKPKNKGALILLLGFLIGIGIHLLFQVPGLLALFLMPDSPVGTTIQESLNVLASSLAAVYTAIAMILYYYDIRLRSEGFDLKLMAKHL